MKLAACLSTLLLIAASQLATADGNKVTAALMDAAHKKADERSSANESSDSDKRQLPLNVNAGADDHRRKSREWSVDDSSLSIASCPMGSPGAPTFEEARNYYRDFTDSEMWKICVNRQLYQGFVSGSCACSLLAYPSPWRPVDTPHTLERPLLPPPYEPNVAIETVPEEPAETAPPESSATATNGS